MFRGCVVVVVGRVRVHVCVDVCLRRRKTEEERKEVFLNRGNYRCRCFRRRNRHVINVNTALCSAKVPEGPLPRQMDGEKGASSSGAVFLLGGRTGEEE